LVFLADPEDEVRKVIMMTMTGQLSMKKFLKKHKNYEIIHFLKEE
jgi:hypothetical protein